MITTGLDVVFSHEMLTEKENVDLIKKFMNR